MIERNSISDINNNPVELIKTNIKKKAEYTVLVEYITNIADVKTILEKRKKNMVSKFIFDFDPSFNFNFNKNIYKYIYIYELLQLQVPLQLPCYDFIKVIKYFLVISFDFNFDLKY